MGTHGTQFTGFSTDRDGMLEAPQTGCGRRIELPFWARAAFAETNCLWRTGIPRIPRRLSRKPNAGPSCCCSPGTVLAEACGAQPCDGHERSPREDMAGLGLKCL